MFSRYNLRLVRRVCGDDGTVIWLLFPIFMNSVEIEEDTDVDLTVSVIGAVGRALKNSEKN